MTPLAQEVIDVIDAIESEARLLLLKPHTKIGGELAVAARLAREKLNFKLGKLSMRAELAEAAVEGLLDQNEKLTRALQSLESLVEEYDTRPDC